MAVVRFIAKRSLVSGHSENDTIELAIVTREPFNRGREVKRSTSESLDYTTETLYYAGRRTWSISTIILYGDDAEELVEFLDSVEDGQIFEFSPYENDPITANEWRNVVASAGYTEVREVSTGTPANDGYSYAFSVAEVAQ